MNPKKVGIFINLGEVGTLINNMKDLDAEVIVICEGKSYEMTFNELKERLRLNEKHIAANIGMLRQWLNEDRIKVAERFVTNEQIEHWLFSEVDKENK